MRRITTTHEFTLLEVLIYLGIFVILLRGFMLFAFSMLTASQRAITQIEIADNSRFTIQKLQRVLQGAKAINSPAIGASAASLSINTATASWNPFVIDVANGALRFKKGTAAPIPITNSLVTVSSVSFKNYSFSPNTKNTIRFKARITSVDPLRPASNSIDIFISIQ